MTSMRLPVPDRSTAPLEFVDAMLEPEDSAPGHLVLLFADDDGRDVVSICEDAFTESDPAPDVALVEGILQVCAGLRPSAFGLILCRSGLPAINAHDRGWNDLVGGGCALIDVPYLGLLVRTPDGTRRVA